MHYSRSLALLINFILSKKLYKVTIAPHFSDEKKTEDHRSRNTGNSVEDEKLRRVFSSQASRKDNSLLISTVM